MQFHINLIPDGALAFQFVYNGVERTFKHEGCAGFLADSGARFLGSVTLVLVAPFIPDFAALVAR